MYSILAVIAFMVLLVVYFLVRSQSVEKELKVQKNQSKSSENQAKTALMATNTIVSELQKMLLIRLENAKRQNTLATKHYQVAKTLYENMDKVVVLCCEKGSTFTEAADKTFASTSPNITEIKAFLGDCPNDVRTHWTRNTVNSFISACARIADLMERPAVTAKPAQEQPAQVEQAQS